MKEKLDKKMRSRRRGGGGGGEEEVLRQTKGTEVT